MLALDTNVLVRVLVDDPGAEAQCLKARRAVSDATKVFVPQVVQVETAWVLSRAYGLSREDLHSTLGTLARHPAFHLQRPEIFQAALETYSNGQADFSDCVILAESTVSGLELATFDRKLGRLPGAKWLT